MVKDEPSKHDWANTHTHTTQITHTRDRATDSGYSELAQKGQREGTGEGNRRGGMKGWGGVNSWWPLLGKTDQSQTGGRGWPLSLVLSPCSPFHHSNQIPSPLSSHLPVSPLLLAPSHSQSPAAWETDKAAALSVFEVHTYNSSVYKKWLSYGRGQFW